MGYKSLANALYFAARGVGYLVNFESKGKIPYTSTARVLLSGLGSDELLGGYGRHRTTFKWGSWSALIQEVRLRLVTISRCLSFVSSKLK
jgi:asparagine synthetase B (glutamine-hydrolysing)